MSEAQKKKHFYQIPLWYQHWTETCWSGLNGLSYLSQQWINALFTIHRKWASRRRFWQAKQYLKSREWVIAGQFYSAAWSFLEIKFVPPQVYMDAQLTNLPNPNQNKHHDSASVIQFSVIVSKSTVNLVIYNEVQHFVWQLISYN